MLVRCIEGHVYDKAVHSSCPSCEAGAPAARKLLEDTPSQPSQSPKSKGLSKLFVSVVVVGLLATAGGGFLWTQMRTPASISASSDDRTDQVRKTVAGTQASVGAADLPAGRLIAAETRLDLSKPAPTDQLEPAPASQGVDSGQSGDGVNQPETSGQKADQGTAAAPEDSNVVARSSDPDSRPYAAVDLAQEKTALLSVPPAQRVPADGPTDCDRLAMSPIDPDRVQGVEGVLLLSAIDSASALAACSKEVENSSQNRRAWANLGRALRAANQPDKAAAAYGKAASLGSAFGLYGLGLMLRDGLGIQKDEVRYRDLMEQSAKGGFVPAYAEYGRALQGGVGGRADPDGARSWFEKGVEANDRDAKFYLGVVLSQTKPPNLQRAAALFRQLADAGDGRGFAQLGYLAEFGMGRKQDLVEARQMFREASSRGDFYSMRRYAEFEIHGWGGPKDADDGKRLLEANAQKGDLDALQLLGVGWRHGWFGAENLVEAQKYLRAAADKKKPDAMVELGLLYWTGTGVSRDLQQARFFFQGASEQGHIRATTFVGIFYENGLAVPQDYAQAWRLLDRSAAAGDGVAMFHLGQMTEMGWGVAKDPVEARNWYEKAALKGVSDALWRRSLLADRGAGVAKDPLDAARLAMDAFKNGSNEARQALLAEATTVMSGDTLAVIQRLLGKQGLYLAPIGGRMSKAAREALQKWASGH